MSLWTFCFYFPIVVLGCSCHIDPLELTDLQSACTDYGNSNDVYAAKVVDSDWCRCSDLNCHENHTAEVVEVFKGKHKIGDRILLTVHHPHERSKWSCSNVYDRYLYVGTTYLFGIGGACSRTKLWTPSSVISHEVIKEIARGCSSCYPGSFTFQRSLYEIYESQSTVLIELLLSFPVSRNLTVQVRADNDSYFTATEGVDFTSGPYSITYPAGSINASFSISITNDTIYESGLEFAAFVILKESLPTCTRYGSIYSLTTYVLIYDDDVPININFSKSSYTVKESLRMVQLELLLTGSYSAAFVVNIQSRDITATGKGVDYDSGPYEIAFPPGVTKAPFTIPITNDGVLEGTESFNLYIKNTSLPEGIFPGEYYETTVTIYN